MEGEGRETFKQEKVQKIRLRGKTEIGEAECEEIEQEEEVKEHTLVVTSGRKSVGTAEFSVSAVRVVEATEFSATAVSVVFCESRNKASSLLEDEFTNAELACR